MAVLNKTAIREKNNLEYFKIKTKIFFIYTRYILDDNLE